MSIGDGVVVEWCLRGVGVESGGSAFPPCGWREKRKMNCQSFALSRATQGTPQRCVGPAQLPRTRLASTTGHERAGERVRVGEGGREGRPLECVAAANFGRGGHSPHPTGKLSRIFLGGGPSKPNAARGGSTAQHSPKSHSIAPVFLSLAEFDAIPLCVLTGN